ncbi:hypothetical protein [Micromonospora chersina]|uniref:hypothetical protein n=1 Tax=Micromonospora chersina TaxID=47854 RepID=UPI0033DC5875
MAVTVVGTPTSNNTAAGTSNSLVTTLPAGWAAGDLAVLVGHLSGGSLNMTTPSGWTALPGGPWPVTEGAASRMYAWYRVLQAGDTAPTIAVNGAMTGGWEMVVVRDAAGVAQAATATASGTSVSLPTLTGVLAGSALVAVAHCRVASGTIPTGLSPAAAYTEVVDHATSRITSSANVRMDASYRVVGSAGSYGGEAITSDVTGSMVGLLVEVTAASVDATVAPDGLTVPVTLGSPAVDGTLTAAPDGLALPIAVGSPAADWATTATPDGLPVPVAVGTPAADWTTTATPDGLPVPVAVGAPTVDWSATVAPDGLVVPVAVGAPSTVEPGQVVHRPASGATARPSNGLVARPQTGVIARP